MSPSQSVEGMEGVKWGRNGRIHRDSNNKDGYRGNEVL
jgi:hypothetical protein